MLRLCGLPIVAAAIVTAVSGPSLANEEMVPLAVSGTWIAMAHQPSMTAQPDVCVAAERVTGFALRASAEGIQLRLVNPSWSLPASVQGDVTIAVGDWKHSFSIDDNTSTMVNAEVAPDLAIAMFAAMDKARDMLVTVGHAKPTTVSLSGSTRATNAFRTCADLPGNVKSPGSNPFE